MDPVVPDPEFPASIASVVLESAGARLNGIVYVAQGPGPHPLVVLLHGYPGDERNLDLAQAVRRAGWNVLFFHYRGAWGSEGEFSFAGALDDVEAAVRQARAARFAAAHRIDPQRVVLVGHSMGGFLALAAASEMPEVRCVGSLAGANLGAMGAALSGDPDRAAAAARAIEAWSAPIRGASGTALVGELERHARRFDTTRRADALAGRPVLLAAGTRDSVAPLADHHAPLVRALERAGADQLTVVILNTDHAFSDQRVTLARHVVAWLEGSCR